MPGCTIPVVRISRRLREHVLLVGRGEALLLVPLLRVGAHHARAGQVLLHQRVQLGELRLHLLEAVVDLPSEVAHQHGDQHQRHERQSR